MEWEQVEPELQRVKVPGGWLVKAYTDVIHYTPDFNQVMTHGYDWRISICFVPDPNHEWKIK